MKTSSAASRIQANLQELFKAKLTPGDAYIKFQLTPEISALLSMDLVQESLVVNTEKITSLPNMPNSVIGIMSSRNRVFCVFDLARLLNLSYSLGLPRHYQVIVLQTTDEQPLYLGLAVTRLQGMSRIPQATIQFSATNFSADLIPYVEGYIVEENSAIPILGFNKIFSSSTLLTMK